MNKKELLNQFPEKKFSDLLKEKLKSVQDINNTITEDVVGSYLVSKEPIFELESLVFEDLKNTIISLNTESIPEYLSKKITNIISKFNLLNSKLGNINSSGHNLVGIFSQLESEIRERFTARLKLTDRNPLNETLVDFYTDQVLNIILLLKNNGPEKGIDEGTLKIISEIKSKGPKAIKIAESLGDFDIQNTNASVSKISQHYSNEAKKIKKKESETGLFYFYNFYWLCGAIGALIGLIGIEGLVVFNVIDIKFYELLPIYSILTIFILFFFKQYNKSIDLYNSYRFKSVSSDFMIELLEFRSSLEDSKVIIEKTLDKILEDPSNQKKGNDSVNLITNNLKTPTGG